MAILRSHSSATAVFKWVVSKHRAPLKAESANYVQILIHKLKFSNKIENTIIILQRKNMINYFIKKAQSPVKRGFAPTMNRLTLSGINPLIHSIAYLKIFVNSQHHNEVIFQKPLSFFISSSSAAVWPS